jgi:Endonuclease/Exonuclease/phosphatase family
MQHGTPLLIATWNVYHGDLQGGVDPHYGQPRIPSLNGRITELINFGSSHNVHLIAFQEIPQTLLPNINHFIGGTQYHVVPMGSEYPPRRSSNDPAPVSGSSDGYAICYNPHILTPGGPCTFYQPNMFRQGAAQARPPVELQFRINNTPTSFTFLTWHAEAQPALAVNNVETALDLLTRQGGNWIIAGDLNIIDRQIDDWARTHHHLTHTDRSKDHIISNGRVDGSFNNPTNPLLPPVQWGKFYSDAHYVLFATVQL